MNATEMPESVTISLAELDVIIRRAVREALHDELSQLLGAKRNLLLDDWSQEGTTDLDGDDALLAEALDLLKRRADSKAGWQRWDEFKRSLS